MPTIEIVSLGNEKGLGSDKSDFKLSLIEEPNLVSHRSLFTDFLSKKNGTIVHLGNPDMDNDSGFFAGGLIDWDDGEIIIPQFDNGETGANQNFYFKFDNTYIDELKCVLLLALKKSPDRKSYFLTDYQFGPEVGVIQKEVLLEEFWSLHNSKGLKWNHLYQLRVG